MVFSEKGKKKTILFWTASLRHPNRPALPLASDGRLLLSTFDEFPSDPQPSKGGFSMVWADGTFFLIDENGAIFNTAESTASKEPSPVPEDCFAIETLASPPDDRTNTKLVRSIYFFTRSSKHVYVFTNGRLDSPWTYLLSTPFKTQGFSSLQLHGNRLVLGPQAPPSRRPKGPIFQVLGPDGSTENHLTKSFSDPLFLRSILESYPAFFDLSELDDAAFSSPEKNAQIATRLFRVLGPEPLGEPRLSASTAHAGKYLRTSVEIQVHEKLERILQAGGNVLVVGPDGSDRDEVVRAFEMANQRGLFPALRSRPFRYLTTLQLNSGRYVGDLDKALSAQFDRTAPGQSARPLFVIENADRLVGEGRYQGQGNDFFDRVAPYLTRASNPVQCIFTVSSEALRHLPARFLSEHFQTIRVEDQAMASDLVEQVSLRVSRRSSMFVPENVVLSALSITRKFNPNLAEPGRTAQFFSAFKDSRRSGFDEREPTSDEIREFAKELYRVAPAEQSREASQKALSGLVQKMGETYFGADGLKQELLALARRYLFGGAVANEPRGRILLVGLPGVGKTSLPRAFSLALFGKPAVEIAMGDHSGGGAYAVRAFTTLLGELHTTNPNAVIVFNEIERAHEDIQTALLAFMEQRTIKYFTGTGKSEMPTHAPTDRAYWFFTSNAAATYFSNLDASHQGVDAESLREYMANDAESSLLPAMLNRMEDIWAIYGPETESDFAGVLELNIRLLLKELSGAENPYPREYTFPDLGLFVRDWMQHRNAFTPRGSVRHHIASIKKTVENAVAVRNETDHPSDLRGTCALSLADM